LAPGIRLVERLLGVRTHHTHAAEPRSGPDPWFDGSPRTEVFLFFSYES
jgi:hypothetical protein